MNLPSLGYLLLLDALDDRRAPVAEAPPFLGVADKFHAQQNVLVIGREGRHHVRLVAELKERDEIVVMHHQQAGSDAGYNGYQFILEEGHASFGLIHFWPGNALKVRTLEKLPLHQWVQIAITYDGSSRASGVKIYQDGEQADLEVVRDSLYKDFANGAPLTVGAAETAQIIRFGADGGPASMVLRSRSALGVQRHWRHTEPAG